MKYEINSTLTLCTPNRLDLFGKITNDEIV
jgi:hypothetical protein